MDAPQTHVLVVDDEESIRHMLETVLSREGYRVRSAADASSALAALAKEPSDLVITDVRMPGSVDGIGLVEKIKAAGHEAAVIVMSAYGSKELALEAIRKGAYHYVNKPFTADEIVLAVAMASERERLRRENKQLKAELSAEVLPPNGMIGNAPSMQVVFATLRKIAIIKSTVLITGESGTGKELIAKAIHDLSPRKAKPFVAVNCGAIPETLIESELFGHAKGAFTGAHAAKKGLVEESAGGTLFLDEIGDLPPPMQVKLLRLLQEDEVRRVGETKTTKIDVRIVAATAVDLQAAVRKGRFREDLYYRLNVLPVHLPPLRERREDIPTLVDHFIGKFARQMSSPVRGVTTDALAILQAYGWSGNVRELENTLERAVVLASGDVIDAASLPEKVRQNVPATAAPAAAGGADPLLDMLGGDLSVEKAKKFFEKELIRRALEKTKNNKTQAAELLELSPRALLYKIRDYGLE
jgi:two-component system, NtrC family, response regulator AtoC